MEEGTVYQLDHCTYLGGSYDQPDEGQEMSIVFQSDVVRIQPPQAILGRRSSPKELLPSLPTIRLPFVEIMSLNISGPGHVTTGGGLIGGGFGVAGALEGIALAGIVNALTTRTSIHTFLQIVTHRNEAFFHYGGREPSALRIFLSPVFARLRHFDPGLLLGQLERLAACGIGFWAAGV